MATGLTHSFARKADMMMSTPAAQQFGEPWDIFPDPNDPHEKHHDEGRTEFGVFGPMPSNPAKRARYMLLANYLELAGSGATMGGASEREKREEEQHFERSVFAHTLQEIDHQLYQVNEDIRRVDIRIAHIDKQLMQHRTNLAALRTEHAQTQQETNQVQQETEQTAAEIKTAVTTMAVEDRQHADAVSDINQKIRVAQEKYDTQAEAFAAQNGFKYDPKTHRFKETETGRTVSIYSHPELMNSPAGIAMERAGLEVFALKQQAGQLDSEFKDRRKLEERFLESKRLALEENTKKLAELQSKLAEQDRLIKLEEARITQLETEKKDATKEREELLIKKQELEQTRSQMTALQDANMNMRENLAMATKIRETSHANFLTKYANDPKILAQENEAFTRFQTASAGLCSIDPNKPPLGITTDFNALQALVAEEKSTNTKGPSANAQASAVATADAAQLPPKDGAAVDPVNGDTSADAGSVADPAKPAEQKQDQQTADAADQPDATQGTTQTAQPQQKKAPVNTNSGMG